VESARARYERRLAETAAIRERIAGRQRGMIALRTGLFFLAAGLLLVGYGGMEPATPLRVLGWLAAAGFLVAITVHEHFRLADDEAARSMQLYQRLIARLDRNWSAIPASSPLHDTPSTLAEDLDLFGPASLWQWLSLGGTAEGRQTLAQWLLTPPDWATIRQRQAAVRDLCDAHAQRESLVELISTFSDGTESASTLANWASGPRWLTQHRFAHALSWIGPALLWSGIALFLLASPADAQSWRVTGVVLAGAGALLNLLVTVLWGSWIHDIFVRITGRYRQASQVSAAFHALGKLPGSSERLASIRARAAGDDAAATTGFRDLMRWVVAANLQRDPLFYIVYLLLQLLVMWDFRVLERFEAWQGRYGNAVHGWFAALGEAEALIVAATVADEYPQWGFPGPLTDAGELFFAEQLGHPLLPDAARVTNDLRLTAAQPLLLVTGSNMAGKSTLLRAWGLNELLLRIGAPVCAAAYRSPVFELATSIRVRDSLREGVSFFMAELKRLKEVVDTAEAAALATSPADSGDRRRVLFLLDEILQGTNSRERQIAVMKVSERLLQFGACGAISTHDLELADQPALQQVSQIVHFREFFDTVEGQERMRFDFRMRPGPTPTTNALKLLKLVGLDREPS
jgi:hypothetical protein